MNESNTFIFDLFCISDYFMYNSAALAHVILREKLHIFGILGCALCVVGSTTIVLHAPRERQLDSVKEIWDLATEPGNLILQKPFFSNNNIQHQRIIFDK